MKMKNEIVRVKSFELANIKNVNSGQIEIDPKQKNEMADIIGIYGQNGSGKTAVVDAFNILQRVMTGNSLPEHIAEFITKNEQFMYLVFEFIIETDRKYYAKYECKIGRNAEKLPFISQEKLTYRENEDSGRKNKSIIYDACQEDWITPRSIYKELGSEKITDLIVAKKMSEKERKSFFFNQDAADCFDEKMKVVKTVLYALHNFACEDLFVIENKTSNIMGLNVFLPFFVKYKKNEAVCFGTIPMPLNEIAEIDKKHYEDLLPVVEIINPVLNEIIPGLSIGIESYGEQLNEEGEKIIRAELVSIKDNRKIPFRYESEGIKKIVSILALLIAMYNERSLCMVIDELDAGIFEFLLGELLSVLADGGLGQLIFTSHNLRPLEVLEKDNIVFTTTNPQRRYIRFAHMKRTNNLRDSYIRALNLGGQKEEVYKATSLTKISRAFRKAKRGTYPNQVRQNIERMGFMQEIRKR